MFTGLVAATGTIATADRDDDGTRLRIDAGPLAAELAEGDSIAVNGVCLTATAVADGAFAADVMAETLRRSSLGPLGEGDRVNLELPLRASDRLGGHVVQGHVDGVGTIASVEADGFASIVTIELPGGLERYVVEKGSITVDGVSLTVAAIDGARFAVSLIPETTERTTLGEARPGRTVNLEVDVLAKYVEKLTRAGAEP